jgi:hypothetical protein
MRRVIYDQARIDQYRNHNNRNNHDNHDKEEEGEVDDDVGLLHADTDNSKHDNHNKHNSDYPHRNSNNHINNQINHANYSPPQPPPHPPLILLWRFLPDLLSLLSALLMSPLVTDKETQGWLWFVGIPTLFLALLLITLFQRGTARRNLTVWLLESTLMTTLGYSSYALYLFQRIVFTFYLPLVYIGTWKGHYGMDIGNEDPWKGGPWFEQLPLVVKLLWVGVLTGVCWATHRYFQDGWVVGVYTWVVRRVSVT